ncbi:hypothetical protein CEXT_193341 [Caerostris extrusa]|uniref:Uncharacterized protein n=1 Tax=Caerostris extrusa TaxID=172846 RepID=A0AAV4S1N7_CAEEX|nr:hypothetical protein CEXT_193341 [Caerostris extrusa]
MSNRRQVTSTNGCHHFPNTLQIATNTIHMKAEVFFPPNPKGTERYPFIHTMLNIPEGLRTINQISANKYPKYGIERVTNPNENLLTRSHMNQESSLL